MGSGPCVSARRQNVPDLLPSALSLHDRSLKRIADPGEFRIFIGLDGPEQSFWLTP
jgi:hypothetical protein